MAETTGIESIARVGVAQYRVGQAPLRMMTMALGSCIGIVLYDGSTRIGALAHVMHPRRDRVKNNGNRAKFVDSAIPLILARMVRWGARRDMIVAKLFGGARMFDSIVGNGSVMQIGEENVAAARTALASLGIPVVAECVGGTRGRTIVVDLADGSVLVRDAESNEERY